MAKATAPVCSCGAAYDSSGVCTRCGKKRPRSGGWRVLHTILCALGALILFFCLSNTHALRTYLASDALTDSLRDARISDASVPFTGKNVTELIMDGYVTDSNVTAENVAAAADNMQIPAFLAGKLNGHFSLLRGESDLPVTISADEITAELDRISDSLAETGGILVDDTDCAQINDALGGVLRKVNGLSTAFGSNQAGRAVQRFGVSVWAYALALILLGLLFVRWCVVRKNSGRDIAGAIKGLGLTALIPSALGLILVVTGGVRTWFIKDGIIGLNGVTKVLRAPYWFIMITGVTFGIFLLELAALLRARAKHKTEQAGKPVEPVPLDPRPALPEEAFSMPASAEEQAALEKACVSCGKMLDAKAKFCIYCGAEQTAAVSHHDGNPADAELPDDPAVPET